MPQLFVLPRQVPLSSSASLLAGAKLTFSATGSSTLQNTYSDIALTTPNANPVIADANGVFSKIYLDPTLPNYRVKLTTSADVLIYQEDDIPSNQNTAQQFRLKHTAPELIFEETDASANNKKWSMRVNGETFTLATMNDAESLLGTLLTISRSGSTPGLFNFAGQYLYVDGKIVATQESGSFTATLTGFTTTVTGTVQWRRSGSKVALFIPSAITGTSNATSMSMTGMPAALAMSVARASVQCIVTDNGADAFGKARIQLSTDPTSIAFSVGVGSNFTNSGTKGLPAGTQIIWDSDGVSIA